MQAADKANQLRLGEIVQQHGWTQKKNVGESAAFAGAIQSDVEIG